MGKIIKLQSVYSLSPKELSKLEKKERKRKKAERLQHFADKLNDKLPKSEVWFMEFYKYFQDRNDVFNDPIDRYIFDILNRKYMYAIEVDGSIHDLPEIKLKDAKKAKRIKSLGYKLIRVRHNNMDDLKKCIYEVLARRGIKTFKQRVIKDGVVILDLDFTDIKLDNNFKSKPKKECPLTKTKSDPFKKSVTILRKKI